MTIQFHGARLSTTENDLAEFEHLLPTSLPDDYRRFLLTHNGGAPAPNAATSMRQGISTDWFVHVFYALGGIDPLGDLADLGWQYENLRRQFGTPPSFVPIADTVCEHTLLVSLAPADFGVIYAWFNHPDPPRFDLSERHKMFNSFSQLFESLDCDGRTQHWNPAFGPFT